MRFDRHPLQKIIAHPKIHLVILVTVFFLIQLFNMVGILSLNVSFIRALGYFMIIAIVVLGFFILLGYAGLASLGTAGFIGLGTYLTGYFVDTLSWPVFLVLILVLVVGALIGLIVGFISLRIEGLYLAIVTLALSEALVAFFKNPTPLTNGVSGFSMLPPTIFFGTVSLTREVVYFLIVIIFLLVLIMTHNITISPLGRAMLAMKNSESAAQTMGISLLKYRLIAFVFTTVLSMLAGFLYMLYYRYSSPPSWSLALSLNVLAAVVIGGTKSIWGLLLGVFFIFGLNDLVLTNIRFFIDNPGVVIFVNGFLMIIIVLFYPGGFSQGIKQIQYRLQNRKLKANHGK
jgi:branched-chain amino acid transport system permease protein